MADNIKKVINTDGSISWRVRYDLPPDPVTGRRREKRETCKTEKEAKATLAARRTAAEQGTAVESTRTTLREYLERWLESAVRPTVRETTYRRHAGLVRMHVVPYLGNVPLQRLGALQVQELYDTLRSCERRDGKGGTLSPRSVRYVHVVLKQALKQAVRWRLVPYNAAEGAEPPRAVRPHIDVWDADEAARFLEAAQGDSYGAIWEVALGTGLRKGELLALRWCDVELDRATLHVRRTLTETEEGVDYGEPKTKAGRRTLKLSGESVEALRAQRATRPLAIDAEALVFTSAAGTPISQRNLSRRFYALTAKAGLKHIPFHGLRHTHATLLLAEGVNVKAVSARLGHASIQITLDTYAHWLPQMDDQAAAAIGRALGRRT
jgi:integrase